MKFRRGREGEALILWLQLWAGAQAQQLQIAGLASALGILLLLQAAVVSADSFLMIHALLGFPKDSSGLLDFYSFCPHENCVCL